MWCHAAAAQQPTATAEYQVYQLRYKPVAEVEPILRDMLPEAGTTAHLIADPRSHQLLLRGPDSVQQIARQLIDSIDRPPAGPVAHRPMVRGYPCPTQRDRRPPPLAVGRP